MVGAFADAVFGITELTLERGDRIFFFTDGLIETGGTYDDGLSRLADACFLRRTLPLQDLVPAVVDDVMTGFQPADDILLMGVQC